MKAKYLQVGDVVTFSFNRKRTVKQVLSTTVAYDDSIQSIGKNGDLLNAKFVHRDGVQIHPEATEELEFHCDICGEVIDGSTDICQPCQDSQEAPNE